MEYTSDLLQSQIAEQCRLNMPQGLRELMTDISREVLRAQPTNFEAFIANYLSALLVTRDNLTIAAQICTHVCECDFQSQLLSELQDLGLDENTVEIVYDIIMNYLNKEKVHEGSLISTLMKNTKIDPSVCPAVLQAVRTAYLRQQALKYTKYEMSSESEEDEIAKATSHTLSLYRQIRPRESMYKVMADKIKASYRGYGVRRDIKPKNDETDSTEELVTLKNFQLLDVETTSTKSSLSETLDLTTSMQKNRITTVSSLSLAGSFSCLFKHKPYNTHDIEYLSELEETAEKEHAHIDYTTKSPRLSLVTENKIWPKRITFENESKVQDGEAIIDRYNNKEGKKADNNTEELVDECIIAVNESDHESIRSVDNILSEDSVSFSSNSNPEEILDPEGLNAGENNINNGGYLDNSRAKNISRYFSALDIEGDTESDDNVDEL